MKSVLKSINSIGLHLIWVRIRVAREGRYTQPYYTAV